ncbi:LLM class flavin-dependent oxidoreductase [[Eubacterium] cellulosolvens]
MGLYFTERFPIWKEIEYCKLAEEKGFYSVWQGQSRMARDSILPLAAIAAVTKRLKLGSGVIHTWTRNPAMIAVIFSTLDEISRGRALLGIGALWEPMASKIGIRRDSPMLAVREYVQVLQRLFRMETVTFHGEHVNLTDIRLERPTNYIPVYIGATGFKMIELAGEIADGVVLNYMVSPEYNKNAMKHIETGARKAGRHLSSIDRPQLVACSLDEDSQKAIDAVRPMVTEYLGMEPHIMKMSGVRESLVNEIHEALGGWPPRSEGLEKAIPLVEDKIVQMLTASGTADECRKKVQAYVDEGCTCPLLWPIGTNVQELIETFAE